MQQEKRGRVGRVREERRGWVGNVLRVQVWSKVLSSKDIIVDWAVKVI
jgi:hypothetical protein